MGGAPRLDTEVLVTGLYKYINARQGPARYLPQRVFGHGQGALTHHWRVHQTTHGPHSPASLRYASRRWLMRTPHPTGSAKGFANRPTDHLTSPLTSTRPCIILNHMVNYWPRRRSPRRPVASNIQSEETMHPYPVPGESPQYGKQRDALLEAEMALRDQRERVAELRRQLPAGPVLRDYVFREG
ncbi:MAG: DUF899 family protein, partial [bacterium]